MTAALEQAYVVAGLLLGLGGSLHCATMCGGIASTLGQASSGGADPGGSNLGCALLYNAGRIASYTLAGALVGSVGLGFTTWGGAGGGVALRIALGIAIALTGLTLAGFTRVSAPLEALGARVWRRLAPLTRRLGPSRGGVRLVAVGALWGWIPCGLVYTALAASLATGSPQSGAAFMLAFGVGTLPSLLAAGAFAGRVAAWLRRSELRRALGVLVVTYGLWTVAGALGMGAGEHHHAPASQATDPHSAHHHE